MSFVYKTDEAYEQMEIRAEQKEMLDKLRAIVDQPRDIEDKVISAHSHRCYPYYGSSTSRYL
jgi:hypothetical protein